MQTVSLPHELVRASRDANEKKTDEALIRMIAEGDRSAMLLLYTRYRVRVYHFVLRIIRDRALAEDVVSEVFLDVWRHAGRFQGKSRVSTWLLAIGRNKALGAIKRRPLEVLDEGTALAIVDPSPDPEVATHDRSRGAVIRGCLEQLSAAQREVMDLVYYHEKSVDEVAHIVGVPPATVKTRMFYARSRMAELLKQAGVEDVCMC